MSESSNPTKNYLITSCKSYDPWLDVLQNDPVPILQRDGNILIRLAKVIDLGLIEKPEIHFKTAAEFKEGLLNCT
ncbi:hypothetical protein H6F32_11885 [Anabaena sp. FACHB-1237]|uniref:hypothetical protein n=1 Tax=Anabaena sp. FACHB-1237 TaxID=2692769 RepID=UPI0016807454|nr:hypothetical protein [Anabaena sp. FACHB-1237]MBD2138273.1 hypothetical protein [Anabaena sp. FACHB-1237]